MKTKLTVAAVVFLIVAFLTSTVWLHFATMTTVTAEIIKTERVIGADKSSKYLVFAKDETFENVDSWLALKFNSSDVYGRIASGQTCELVVTGFRMPIFSMYRNILTANCQ